MSKDAKREGMMDAHRIVYKMALGWRKQAAEFGQWGPDAVRRHAAVAVLFNAADEIKRQAEEL